MRPRILSYDSTFGFEKTDRRSRCTTDGVAGAPIAVAAGGAVFDDTGAVVVQRRRARRDRAHPGRYQPGWYSVDVPKTGTTIKVAKPGMPQRRRRHRSVSRAEATDRSTRYDPGGLVRSMRRGRSGLRSAPCFSGHHRPARP